MDIYYVYSTVVGNDFINLTNDLDIELNKMNGELQSMYNQFNKVNDIKAL